LQQVQTDEENPDMEVTDRVALLKVGRELQPFTLVQCDATTTTYRPVEGRLYSMSNVPEDFIHVDCRYNVASGGKTSYTTIDFGDGSGPQAVRRKYRQCAGARYVSCVLPIGWLSAW
jgi:hypothetical protein